jgi:hypothetical protein
LPGGDFSTIRRSGPEETPLNTGEEFDLRGFSAAAVMAHPVDDGLNRQVAPGHVDFVDQLNPAATLAFYPQEPRREGPEGPRQRLGG